MKKTIIALAIAFASTASFASGHIGNQSGHDNDVDIQVGDIQNVMGNICYQSGNNNDCDVEIDNVNGELTIGSGANVTINQSGDSYDDSVIKDRVIASEDRLTVLENSSDQVLHVSQSVREDSSGITSTQYIDGADEYGHALDQYSKTKIGKDGRVTLTTHKFNGDSFDTTNASVDLASQSELDAAIAAIGNGKDGEKGDTGAAGKDGEKGDTGAAGKDGEKGDTGAAGKDGEKGDTGAAGKDGAKGDAGKDGAKGDAGKDGVDGITTIVNEYDKDQVDADFTSEEERQSDKDRQANTDNNQDIRINQTSQRVTDVQETLYQEGLIRAKSDKNIVAASKKRDADLQAQVDTKVETTVYEADQARQDEAAAQAKIDQAVVDTAQDEANKTARDTIVTNQAAFDVKQDEANRQARVDMEVAQANVDYNQNSKIDNNTTAISNNRTAITANSKRIDGLESRVDTLEDNFAMMAAMANLTEDDLTAAVGYSAGSVALAVGFNAELTENTNLKASVSTNFDNVTMGVGVGYNF